MMLCLLGGTDAFFGSGFFFISFLFLFNSIV